MKYEVLLNVKTEASLGLITDNYLRFVNIS